MPGCHSNVPAVYFILLCDIVCSVDISIPSQYYEHQRVFRPFRHPRRSSLPYARPRRMLQWNQKFYCLATKNATQVPMARAQKLALWCSGLGKKYLRMSFDSTAEQLHQELLSLFPSLSTCGGYELLRCSQGSWQLVIIPPSGSGYTHRTPSQQS